MHNQIIGPTPELSQHHDTRRPWSDRDTRREFWSVKTRLDGLLESGRIDDPTYRAAIRYRDDYARGREVKSGRSCLDRTISGGVGDPFPKWRIEAAIRMDEADKALKPAGMMLVVACVVHDMSLDAVGRLAGIDRKTARNRTVDALKILFDHYELADGVHRQGSGRIRSAIVADNFEENPVK